MIRIASTIGRRVGGGGTTVVPSYSSSSSIFTPAVVVATLNSNINTNTLNNSNTFNTTFQVRTMATKKAGGSTSNGRDSAGRRLGVKLLHNEQAKAGSILVRQRGQKYRAGTNVGMGKDHTLFAKVAGKVQMEKIQLKHIGCTATGNSRTTIKRRKRIRTVLSIKEYNDEHEHENEHEAQEEVGDEAQSQQQESKFVYL